MTGNAITQFWNTFADHTDFFAIPDNPMEAQMMVVLDALKQVDPRLYYHIGYHDQGVDFLLSAEGHFDLSQTIAECVSLAPKMPGWRIRPILDSKSLSGERDERLFPNDENGDVLFGIAEQAGDLITIKDVDYCHIFPSEEAARIFAQECDDGVTIEPYDGEDGFSWEVVVTRQMVPSHDNVSEQETHLAGLAARHGGRPDGWGFLST